MDAIDRGILSVIEKGWREQWTSPTVREIQRAIPDLSGPSAVHHRLVRLEHEGHLLAKRCSVNRVVYRTARQGPCS